MFTLAYVLHYKGKFQPKFKSCVEEQKEKTAMLEHKYCFSQQSLGGIQDTQNTNSSQGSCLKLDMPL